MEDAVGDRHLADVVQQPRRGDPLDLDGVETEVGGHGARHLDDGLGVLAGVAVTLEQRRGEGLDHRGVGGVGVVDAVGQADRRAGAAERPGAVEAAGARGEEIVEGHALLVHGDAGRHGDEAGAGDVAGLELGDQALAAGLCARQVGAGHEHGELVGTRAPEAVGGARQAPQVQRDRRQGRVARLGSAARVEGAEAVDVDDGDAHGPAVALRAGQLAPGGAAERVMAVQARAGVAGLTLVELGLELLDLRLGLRELQAQRLLVPRSQHVGLIGGDQV